MNFIWELKTVCTSTLDLENRDFHEPNFQRSGFNLKHGKSNHDT